MSSLQRCVTHKSLCSCGGALAGVCSAPDLIATSKTRKDDPYGRTAEVPRRAARTRHSDGHRTPARILQTRTGAYKRVADQLGAHPEALRTWVKRAEVDEGLRPGTTSDDSSRLAELEREVKELRRANTILRQASAFFAAELDRPHR
ncbi:putative transposase (plasmid) [Rhodococcus erythropolis PR4]|uniref:Putative transposase n=1 Tax=Rhodococcus erythropolis (strain PR4 / NBRC 100887) TaxID=234621 RepID=Q3L9I3_RHOE4|nr:putative transposase [Rhodococcus erythropolis PR4]